MPRWTRIRHVDMNSILSPSRRFSAEERSAPKLFAKQASGVCQLYSTHLAQSDPVPALTWWVRLLPEEDPKRVHTFRGTSPAETTWGNGEVFHRLLDPTILDLPLQERPRRYLDWLQGNLLSLAEARGWPVAGFAQAHARCVADGVRMAWDGPAKTSPDRRYKAVPRYEFDLHGDCWLMLTVRDRSGGLVATGGPWDCFPERYLTKSARSLRWEDSTALSIQAWPADIATWWSLESHHSLALPPPEG